MECARDSSASSSRDAEKALRDAPPLFVTERITYSIVQCTGHIDTNWGVASSEVSAELNAVPLWKCVRGTPRPQLTLRLGKLCFLRMVVFTKGTCPSLGHARDVALSASADGIHWIDVCSTVLQNSPQKDRAPVHLYNRRACCEVPVQYIRLEMISNHGSPDVLTLHPVEVFGYLGPALVYAEEAIETREDHDCARRTLRYLRLLGLETAYEAAKDGLSKQWIESREMRKLYDAIVLKRDMATAEDLVRDYWERSHDRMREAPQIATWVEMLPNATKPQSMRPPRPRPLPAPLRAIMEDKSRCGWPPSRGGHQLCCDSERGIIFLFGGWSGEEDLGDFWAFVIDEGLWYRISNSAEAEGGPSPRSCHKMCISTNRGKLYCLGRYLDRRQRAVQGTSCEFYEFDMDEFRWRVLSTSTLDDGGPDLVYDHQMVYDESLQQVVVLGGRILGPTSSVSRTQMSGLFSFDVGAQKWSEVQIVYSPKSGFSALPMCMGHSVVSDNQGMLYILGGHGSDGQMICGVCVIDLRRRVLAEVPNDPFYNASASHQMYRMAFDDATRSLVVLAGERPGRKSSAATRVAVLDTKTWQWTPVLHSQHSAPCPMMRFAYHLCRDAAYGEVYIFGGNANLDSHTRLSDMWQLRLDSDGACGRDGAVALLRLERLKQLYRSGDDSAVLAFLRGKMRDAIETVEAEGGIFLGARRLLCGGMRQVAMELCRGFDGDSVRARQALFDVVAELVGDPQAVEP